jgi:type II secretory ATPase GspE/PulE/Tfp pilus assembly ATPase PilB-like protein
LVRCGLAAGAPQEPAGPLYRGRGCKACHQTGYRGRVGLFELFTADEQVEEMIVAGRREAEIASYLESRGMRPILIDGLAKARQGVTTLMEVERSVAG